MNSLDEWMNAYRRTGGATASLPTDCRVPPDVLFAFAGDNPERWQSLVGCQIRLLGKGFGEVVRVEGLTLWLRMEGERQGKHSTLYAAVEVDVSGIEGSRITGVLFPAGYQHVLVHAAAILQKVVSPPKRSTSPALPQFPPSTGQSQMAKPVMQAAPVAPVVPADPRAQEIKEFCQKQGIEYLVHFTRAENVEQIVTHGLVSRVEVDRWRNENGGTFPFVSDRVRRDDVPNAICLSISFPNYIMFSERRQQGGEWVVIRLHASILWELPCVFCYRNAANEYVRRTDIKKRESANALKAMFADIPEGVRAKLAIPDRYTTDPQAEVLVLENIPVKYIESVFYEQTIPASQSNQATEPQAIAKRIDKRVFAPRIDSRYWLNGKVDFPFSDEPPDLPPASTHVVMPARPATQPKQAPPAPPKRPDMPPTTPVQPTPGPVKSPTLKKDKRPSPLPAAKTPSRSSAKASKRSAPKQQAKPPARNVPVQKPMQLPSPQQVELVHVRTIAKLWDMPLADARNYLLRVQALCMKPVSHSAISAACRQLAYERPTERVVAARASEIAGWSASNVKPGNDEPRIEPSRLAPVKPSAPENVQPPARTPATPSPVSPAQPPSYTEATVQGPAQSKGKSHAPSGGGRASYSSPNANEQEPMRTDANSRLPKNPLRSKNRIDPGKSAICPHGVPYYKKCHICNPDEFDK